MKVKVKVKKTVKVKQQILAQDGLKISERCCLRLLPILLHARAPSWVCSWFWVSGGLCFIPFTGGKAEKQSTAVPHEQVDGQGQRRWLAMCIAVFF